MSAENISDTSIHESTWQTPIPFTQTKPPELDIEKILQGEMLDYVLTLAESVEVPVELPLMAMLGVVSACCAKRYMVSPKEGWYEPVNLYSIVALPPGNNKSLVLRECVAPLVAWENEQREIMQKERIRQLSIRKSQEKVIEAKRNKLASIKNEDEQQRAFDEIAQLEADLQEVSALPQLFANDATPESLSHSVAEQKGRFAVFSDEAGVLNVLSGLYTGGSANVDILLKGIDGGHVRVRRKDRSYDLNPYLTLMLAIQPAMLQQMAKRSAFQGNGLLERFLYVMPVSKLGFRSHQTRPVPEHLKHYYHRLIEQLLKPLENSSQTDDETVMLTLSSEAQSVFHQFRLQIERQLRPDGRLHAYSGWGGKICGYSLRIAALLHIIEESTSHATSHIIAEDTLKRAMVLAEFLIEHLCRVFPYMGVGGDSCQPEQNAEKLWEWFKKQDQLTWKKSDITYGLRQHRIGKAEVLNPALEELEQRHYLKSQTDATTKRPTTYYQLNPFVMEGVASAIPCYANT